MEVLVQNAPAFERWSLDVVCTGNGNGGHGCDSVLRVKRNDLRYFAEQEFPWRIQPAAVTIKCPVCNVMTDLDRNDWPHKWTELKEWSSAWRDGTEENVEDESTTEGN